ncbi:MAG: AAA family ATPase [Candidatus Thorarchaeota archaeon]|nr:AAA family ATPase [Candidatus Thorarchaeota archaeon]
MKRVITIGGLHGTGKSSAADNISKMFSLKRVSAGGIFRQLAQERGVTLEEFSKIAEEDETIDRELDARIKIEAEKGNVMLDGQLAAIMAGDHADIKILLTASLRTRVKRIAARDDVSYEDALHETETREMIERARYKEFYDYDVANLSIYDLVINTEKYDLEGVTAIIKVALCKLFDEDL